MEVRWIDGRSADALKRGDVVVCVSGEPDGARIEHLRAHTPGDVRLLAADTLSVAARASAPADLVVVHPDCVVGDGWLDGLREAALSDARIATVSALAQPYARSSDSADAVAAADAVRAASLRIRPPLPSARGPCVLISRSALELIGVEETGPHDTERAIERFSQRCVQRGLSHVLADDVLVRSPPALAALDLEAIARSSPPVARSLGVARRALAPTHIAIDARNLRGPMNGTMVHVLELIASVARTEQTTLTALVPPDMSAEAHALLAAQPGVRLLTAGAEHDDVRADLVHRPFQIATPADLPALARLADRLVITHQDLISFHNPSYFRSRAAWLSYRELTRRALPIADRVVFSSAHARAEALNEELIDPARASVIHYGVDHVLTRSHRVDDARPAGAERIPDGSEVIACLGSDFRHKNRLFALDVLEALQRRHGWDGRLVLAGPHVELGSSREEERARLAASPELADAVLTLGALSEGEKEWLLRRAGLVAYPTVHEGFGLVPFESADHGVPCLWAPGTSLSDVLPDAEAAIVPWDAAATADRALVLLRDPEAAARQIAAIGDAAAMLRWDSAAQRLLDVYREACDRPAASGSVLERSGGMMREGLSEDAIRLVGPNGALPGDLERPLLALATHRRVGAPVFRAIKAGYRVSMRWRRSVNEG